MKPAYTFIALFLRFALAGVFLFAAYNKLINPQNFSESIQAFHMSLPDWMVLFATYAIPWTEVYCGVALVLGLWTRAAALVFTLLMGVFMVGIVSAINRGLPLNCGCFGKFKLYCDGPLGWCKVRENGVLIGLAILLLVFGGGMASLDRLFRAFTPRPARSKAPAA